MRDFLSFEEPIAKLESQIEELKQIGVGQDINVSEEVARLQIKSQELTRQIFANVTPQQIVQLARHPQRPYTLDYIDLIFSEFDELHGDRHFSDGSAMITGIARLDGQPVVVVGHQKGRGTKEKVERNFGMPKPEGFRKALRVFKMAEKFKLPIISFLDTPGAYPGVGAEERNQSEAIARNLLEMSQLQTPIVSVVIGEGCSGGALGIGVADYIMMLQYSYYSVISPEGCASILWKSAEKASDAAQSLGLTAKRLLAFRLVDEIIEEPLGGAHRDWEKMSQALSERLSFHVKRLMALGSEQLVDQRYSYWMEKGRETE